MKLSTPKDSLDLCSCPFCEYEHPVMTIETYLQSAIETVYVYGWVDCSRCRGRSGRQYQRLPITVKDLGPAVDKVRSELVNMWNGSRKKIIREGTP